MNAAKIRLSSEEAALIERSDWILTKNNIIVKVQKLFECLQNGQQQWVSPLFEQHPSLATFHPKISKGENYRGLPYLVLDNPRCFEKNGIIAVRTMFWWGHFFSVTLHLSGDYKQLYEPKLIKSFTRFADQDYFICQHNDPWEYHYEEVNYLSVKKLTREMFESIIHNKSFVKISAKIPLNKWNDAETILTGKYRELIEVLSS